MFKLSDRETDVLAAATTGCSNKEIARRNYTLQKALSNHI